MFKKNTLSLGLLLGFIGPLIGVFIYKLTKFKAFSLKETLQYFYVEPGHRTLSVALTLALFANAILFTIFLNSRHDNAAKGVFITTCAYGLIILAIKLFS
jgi:membrane-bound metal-dependent hydrolase YbcI (DUF457 family)